MNIRVRFGKEGAMQYIGHLDVLRTFQKIFRRAGIPMLFSQGFNPHPIMSFALPLGLGLSSEGEYLDAGVEEGMSSEELLSRLQKATAEEMPVYAVSLLPERSGNAMSSVGGAVYRLTPKTAFSVQEEDFWQEAVRTFTAEKEILILKKTKTKEAETDIRPMIREMRLENGGFYLNIAAGSAANLSPDLLMETFCSRYGRTWVRTDFLLRRLDLLRADGSSLGEIKTEDGSEQISCDPLP